MITAKPSNNYNLDMVAIPGKITGLKSKGYKTFNYGKQSRVGYQCKRNTWYDALVVIAEKKKEIQRQLFIEMTAEEKEYLIC